MFLPSSRCFFFFFFVQPVKCPHGQVWELTTWSTPLDERPKPTKPLRLWVVSYSCQCHLIFSNHYFFTILGTTWLQEVLWLIMNNGDLKGASEKPVYFRSPFLEFKDTALNEVGLDLAEQVPSPRIIKTHLQKRLAPSQLNQKNCKVGNLIGWIGLYKSLSTPYTFC